MAKNTMLIGANENSVVGTTGKGKTPFRPNVMMDEFWRMNSHVSFAKSDISELVKSSDDEAKAILGNVNSSINLTVQ